MHTDLSSMGCTSEYIRVDSTLSKANFASGMRHTQHICIIYLLFIVSKKDICVLLMGRNNIHFFGCIGNSHSLKREENTSQLKPKRVEKPTLLTQPLIHSTACEMLENLAHIPRNNTAWKLLLHNNLRFTRWYIPVQKLARL